MKLFIVLLALLFTDPGKNYAVVEKEPIDFYGTVIEELTGDPLVGASIFIKELDKIIYTDLEGNFIVEDLPPGEYNFEVTYLSYNKKELNKVKIKPDNNSILISLN